MSGFDLGAMKEAVAKCLQNIETFEAEIKSQRDTIVEYQGIIAMLEATNGDGNNKT
jgi:hypothetical protein